MRAQAAVDEHRAEATDVGKCVASAKRNSVIPQRLWEVGEDGP